jgi:hypothetical protein
MKMLVMMLGCGTILGAGLWMKNPFGAPNVYAMTPTQVSETLSRAKIEPGNTSPFGRLDVETSSKPGKSVTWEAVGSHAAVTCSTLIEPEGADKSRLNVTCGGGGAGNGAAGGLFLRMVRKEVIELVDSTLRHRPYDPQKAKGSTAARWPEDIVHHDNFGQAVGKAIEMDAEMRAETQRGR